MSLQTVARKFGETLTKNSPTILTGLAMTGLVVTTMMAVKATPKAMAILEDERISRVNEPIPPIDMVKLTWQCYLPAAIVGAATMACMIGSNSINLRRNAALASIYSIAAESAREYQAKVIETLGKGKERKIKDDIAKDRITKNPVNDKDIIVTGKGNTLCYDTLSGRYFRSDIEYIRQALNKVSRDLMSEMFITLNEVYSELDLKGIKMGDHVGWHVNDGLIEPDFSSQLTDTGVPCLVLDYVTEPRYGYNNY